MLKLKESAKRVAEKSILMAASRLQGTADSVDVGVSVNGTWQDKGFTSLNGTVISIDSGKFLDTAILSKSFEGRTTMQVIKAKDPDANDKCNAAHKYSLNYKGSSPVMEKVSAEKIIKQSVTKHNLCYTSF